jgi:hypothetical protein
MTARVPKRPADCARNMFSMKGSDSSTEYTSRLKRFTRRPTGVESKNHIGAAITAPHNSVVQVGMAVM